MFSSTNTYRKTQLCESFCKKVLSKLAINPDLPHTSPVLKLQEYTCSLIAKEHEGSVNISGSRIAECWHNQKNP